MIPAVYHILPVVLQVEPKSDVGTIVGVVGTDPNGEEFAFRLQPFRDGAYQAAVDLLRAELERYRSQSRSAPAGYAYSRMLALSARREGIVHFGTIEPVAAESLDSAMETVWMRSVAPARVAAVR